MDYTTSLVELGYYTMPISGHAHTCIWIIWCQSLLSQLTRTDSCVLPADTDYKTLLTYWLLTRP